MTCEDCIYYKACEADGVCTEFSDRSEWVHLPCKVGGMVYVIHDDKVKQAVILAFYVDKVGIICELRISMNGESPTAPCCVTIIDKYTYTDNDIYLTREEAKKALKERERNGDL